MDNIFFGAAIPPSLSSVDDKPRTFAITWHFLASGVFPTEWRLALIEILDTLTLVAVAGDWGGVRRDIDAALSAWSGGLQEDTTVAPTPTDATGLVQVRSCDPDSVNNFAHLLLHKRPWKTSSFPLKFRQN